MLDEVLQQTIKDGIISPWISSETDISLQIAAARRGPLFITVTCKIVESLNQKIYKLLVQLVEDEQSDDTTVSVKVTITS